MLDNGGGGLLSSKDGHYVIIGHHMMQADFLGEGKFARLAVYHRVRKFVDQCTVHTMTHVFNRSTAADYNGVREVRMLATLLGIYPVQVQLVPDPLDEVVEVQVQVTADDSAVRPISSILIPSILL